MNSTGVRLAELGSSLDPRPEADSVANPYAGAANIPADRLVDRLHELPPKGEPVAVCGEDEWSAEARRILEAGGRKVVSAGAGVPREGDGPFRLWRPNEFLMLVLPSLPVGRALELGCGSGREALAMAAAGFRVTACDRLQDALEKGKDLERRYLVGANDGAIQWICADLEANSPLSVVKGGFDLITSFRYLHRPLLLELAEWLNPGGSFVLETFTTLHRDRHGKPSSDHHVLQLGEAPSLVPGLEVVHFDEGWRGDIHTARLWARRTRP